MKQNFVRKTIVLSVCFLFSSVGFTTTRMTFGRKGFLLRVEDRSSSEKWKDRFISYEELIKMEQGSVKARGKEENPERVWKGVLLRTLLEREGIPLYRITKITVSAFDGYMSVLTGDLLKDWQEAICALHVDGLNQFPEKYGYMKLIFPKIMAMYWVNAPNRIIITLGRGRSKRNEYNVYFHENKKFKALFKESGTVARIKVKELLSAFQFPKDRFYVLTRDGLYREYSVNNIIQHMVLTKGDDDTWKIEGVHVPTGLKTRQIFFITGGDIGLFLKTTSHEEKELWKRHVWQDQIVSKGSLAHCTMHLIIQNGHQKKVDISDQFSEDDFSLHDLFWEVFKSEPDLDHIKLRW